MNMELYPKLIPSVILRATTHYVMVKDLYVDKPARRSSVDGFILNICNGGLTANAICSIVAKAYRITKEEAESVLIRVLNANTRFLQILDAPDYTPSRHNLREFFYTCKPLPDDGKLLSPLSATLMLTHSCNYRCIYCYNSSSCEIKPELSTKTWLSLIDELADTTDVTTLTITGGEPMSHPGFFDILQRIYDRGLATDVSTNGSLIDDTAIERFKTIGQKRLLISLDSAEPDMHHYMTNSHGSFERVTNAIRKLTANGIHVDIKSLVTPFNLDGVEDLSHFLQNIGVTAQTYDVYQIDWRGRGLQEKYRLNNAQTQIMKDKIEKLTQTLSMPVTFPVRDHLWDNRDAYSCCEGLSESLVFMSDGGITFCEPLGMDERFVIGKYPEISIMEAWHSSKIRELLCRPKEEYSLTCQACDNFEKCRAGCPAAKLAAGWDIYDTDPKCPSAPDSIFRHCYTED